MVDISLKFKGSLEVSFGTSSSPFGRSLLRIHGGDTGADEVPGSEEILDTITDTFKTARLSEDLGRLLDLSQINSALQVAADAAQGITNLREQQLSLAERASEISDPRELSELTSEVSTIETEIARISSSATFNGTNVLSGNTYGNSELGYAVATNLSPITTPVTVDLSSQSDAESSVSSLTSVLAGARDARDGVDVALDKADGALFTEIQESLSDRMGDDTRIANLRKAEQIAIKTAVSIARNEPFQNLYQDVIASNLDPDRVRGLLEDDEE